MSSTNFQHVSDRLMRWLSISVIMPPCLLLLLIFSGPPLPITAVYGQERAESSGEEDKAKGKGESLVHWQYFAELPPPPAVDSPYYDFHLQPSVFDAAREDLADLRLYDGAKKEVPYGLRVREAKSKLESIEADEFNRLVNDDGTRQISLDLGVDAAEHNELEVLTSGSGFRRRVVIEGSEDREQWNEIVSGYLLNFPRRETTFADATVGYSPSRFRYLRITVQPDPIEDATREWRIETITVRHRVEVPGEQITREVEYGAREPMRTPRGPGSQWLIKLGGSSVPCSELAVAIENEDFVREWRVEAAGPERIDDDFRHVASGTWRRKAGEEKRIFVADFGKEVRAARLKLMVTDYRNPPLELSSIQSRVAVRQVVFESGKALQEPLRLYFGNPLAEAPRYDFARNLPEELDPAPTRLDLGKRQENPVYQPQPQPLTERWPWLVHSVLSAAVLVLAALIADLGRAALRAEAPSTELGRE